MSHKGKAHSGYGVFCLTVFLQHRSAVLFRFYTGFKCPSLAVISFVVKSNQTTILKRAHTGITQKGQMGREKISKHIVHHKDLPKGTERVKRYEGQSLPKETVYFVKVLFVRE